MMTRAIRKAFEAEQRQQPERLTLVPREAWPPALRGQPMAPVQVWRSRAFLVQLYREPGGERLTVSRAVLENDGSWGASIAWDELQQVKREVGFAERWAVEIFPPDSEVVNVANMRHLWLLPEAPAYGWARGRP